MSTYVIVGGVAGGATAATRLRRLDEQAEIILFERGAYVSFANCGLPYHIGGVIPSRDHLLVATPETLRETFNIDVRTRQEVTRIDPLNHEITVKNLANGQEYTQHYDKLLLSPGAKPIVPPLPGVDLPGVYTLRDIPDMDAIIAHLGKQPQDAVIVGGGFIGLEMAENLKRRGLRVSLVEMLPQVMSALDFEMAALIHRELRRQGIRLALGDGLKAISQAENGRLLVTLNSGRTAETDLVILAIGVRPESDLARAAGLALGPRGHILVDEFMRTSAPDIYAVGDAVQVIDPILGRPTAVPLAGPANRQARIAATHMVRPSEAMAYRGTIGTAIAQVFDLTVAATGVNSRTLQEANIPFLTSITHSYDHVGYYPGATMQTIKLLFSSEDGRLFGAQVVGGKAVDRTIDILATAIHARMSVYDLEHLEMAYAPPYGAAKDPVNIAGYVAANALRGDTTPISWQAVANGEIEASRLLDVRTPVEWNLGHIEGARHIPLAELRHRWEELERDRSWVVYCAIGQRAYTAERILKQHGYDVANLSGGYNIYRVATEKQDNWEEWLPEGEGKPMPHTQTALHEQFSMEQEPAFIELDACGLQCPGPIMAVYRKMETMQPGERLRVQATDPGFARDVAVWAEQTGNTLLDLRQEQGRITALLAKGQPTLQTTQTTAAVARGKTIVVFSADLDRALAAFVIANGAAAMGQPVTMFFTFWGLNILRKPQAAPVRKTLIERMFGWMMPKGARALKLSKLNMGGLGTAMMKGIMKAKNVASLEEMIASARELGVRLIACQMSMDLMGIKPEELLDGVEIGGVATYIGETDKVNATLFI